LIEDGHIKLPDIEVSGGRVGYCYKWVGEIKRSGYEGEENRWEDGLRNYFGGCGICYSLGESRSICIEIEWALAW